MSFKPSYTARTPDMDEPTRFQLAELVEYCRLSDRVCPLPMPWNELWEMLPNRRREGLNWSPDMPLILGAWWPSSPQDKRQRLFEHLEWAAERGELGRVDRFIRGLRREDWFHESD